MKWARLANQIAQTAREIVDSEVVFVGDRVERPGFQNIGIQLRNTRQRQGMSQAELAEKAELSTVYISQIEFGQKNINVDVLIRLCDALHTTCDDPLRAKLARSENMAYVLGTIFADCTDEELTAVLQLLQDIKSQIDLVKTTI